MQEAEIPQVALPFVIFSMFLFGVLLLSVWYWIQGLLRWTSGLAVLPKAELHPIQRWGLIDLMLAFVVVVGLQWVAIESGVLLRIGPRPKSQGDIGLILTTWVYAIMTLAVVVMTYAIAQRCKVTASSIGWSTARLLDDIRLGLKAFIVVIPVVYTLMIAATLLSGKGYEHPIQKMASEDPRLLLAAIFMTVILAPIGEEFLFRVLLQGVLESVSVGRFSFEKLFFGRVSEQTATIGTFSDSEPSTSQLGDEFPRSTSLTSTYIEVPLNPYETHASIDAIETKPRAEAYLGASELEEVKASPPWWPIILSGVLFGLAHFEYGMSWIPLSVLGIVLGWLYRVTNRIWPSLVVHVCINATSMIGFSLTVLFGDPTEGIAK
jgi:membrane protease YdiL (CAAX protease family)